MSRTYQLHLNSRFRTSGDLSHWSVDIAPGLFRIPPDSEVTLTLGSFVLCYDFYTVTESNDLLLLDGQEVTLKHGSYNVYTLTDELNSKLNNITVTYDAVANKYRFVDISGNQRTIHFTTASCNKLLGLSPGMTHTIAASSELVSDGTTHMGMLSQLYLVGDVPNDHVLISTSTGVRHSNILAAIPITAPPYSNIVYHAPDDNHDGIVVHGRDLYHFSFRLYDENLIPVYPASDWVVTLNIRVRI